MISQGGPPNGESQLIDRVIAEYLRAEAEGPVGDRQDWLDRYPACAAELAEFLDDRARIDHLMMSVRVDQHVTPGANGRTDVFTPIRRSDNVPTVDLRPDPPKLTSTRYKPLSFHARGGMGEIWLAKDERIGRHVAIKKLRPGCQAQQPRFFVEAQVTGQLEHPSVVPLYDLGLDDAGQPYYVMKFIHGRRLKEAIAQFHARKSAVGWDEDVEFRRLLELVVSVSNVVAYSHHKGVVHRDIKPDNIMLGPYGEVLVVDWGLAKVIGHAEEERGSTVQLSGGGSTATQDGAIVGSPYYMSPEGAEGRPEAVDQSSDVYLLGATLYEILCARPPRQASSNWELIDLALHSRPTSPRKVDPRIPRSLEAICQKAMAFSKRDRYESPLALADDLERYLAGAPTTAYREPFWTRAGRWMRRHRKGLLQAAAALVLLALAAFAVDRSQKAHVLAERELTRQALGEFHQLSDEAFFYAANTDAISERVPYYDPRRAEKAGVAALAIASQWGDRAERFPLADQRADLLHTKYGLLLELAQIGLARAASESELPDIQSLLDRAGKIQAPSRGNHQLRSQSLALLGEVDAARVERERADDPAVLLTAEDHFLAGEKSRLQDVGQSVRTLAGVDATANPPLRREHLTTAMGEYRKAIALDPRHYWARFQLGRCLLAVGRGPEAVEALSACIALRPTSPWAHSARGMSNALSGNYGEAIADLNQAMQIDPDFQPARLNRGVVYWLNHDTDKALADFDALLKAPADKQLVEAAFYRGQILVDQHREQEAIADFSAVAAARPDFAPAYWYRAKAQFGLDNFDAGLADLRKALALGSNMQDAVGEAGKHLRLGTALRNMAQQFTSDARKHPLVAATDELQSAIKAGPPTADMWKQLGAVRELLGQNAEAIEAYSQGLALDADNVALHNMRAWAYVNQQRFAPAQADFSKALRIAPNNAESHAGLGFVLAELSQGDKARNEASIAMLAGADNHLILHNVACIFARLSAARTEERAKLEDLAISALTRAVALSQQNAMGPDANELTLIRNESAFPNSLRSRPEFQRLQDSKSRADKN